MSSPELAVLEGQVTELQKEMREMRLAFSNLSTLLPRVEAVESAQRATDARIQHIDRVVMDIQLNLQHLHKSVNSVETAQSQNATKLDAILTHMQRMVTLMQTKTT